MPSADPPPIRVILPGPGEQEVIGRLHERQQTADGWLYKVSVPAWMNSEDGRVEPAWYTVCVQAPARVSDGVGVG